MTHPIAWRRAAAVVCVVLTAGLAHAGDAPPPPVLDPMSLDLAPWLDVARAVCSGAPRPPNTVLQVGWSGPCHDGQPDGSGSLDVYLHWTTAISVYVTLSHGVAQGHAQIVIRDGGTFDGELRANRPNGHGIWLDGRGMRIEGDFRNGALDGKAVSLMADGAKFEASYRDGVLDGPSRLTAANGWRVQVAYRGGQAQGRCRTLSPDGAWLETNFVAGVESGPARYRDAEGHRHAGAFVPATRVAGAPSGVAMPNLSRRLHEAGTVEVSFTIAQDGWLTDVRLRKSSGVARLDAAALAGVEQWRYHPAMVGDHPVATLVTATVVFTKADWIPQGQAVD